MTRRSNRWLEDRQRAQRLLDVAHDSIAAEAAATAKALDDAASEAPSKPGWFSGAWNHVTDTADGLWLVRHTRRRFEVRRVGDG